MTWMDMLLHLLAAIGLGTIVGLERQLTSHTTGIRTCVLVCVGACLFTSFPYCIEGGDVTRAAMQVVSGVGFLGSGIIFKDGSNVRGLNTAATIWCTAGIGVFAGAGLYLFALLASVCLLIVNIIFRLINRSGFGMGRFHSEGAVYRVSVCCGVREADAIKDKLSSLLPKEQSYVFYRNNKWENHTTVRLITQFFYEGCAESEIGECMNGALSDFSTVREIEWERMG